VIPTKYSLIAVPIKGLSTNVEKLDIPVKNEKTVPSICWGVILANKTSKGIIENANPKVSVITDVRMVNAISLIPITTLSLKTNIKEKNPPKMLT
jgi:hypothetical protein